MSSTTPEGKVKTKFRKKLKEIEGVWEFMPVQRGYGKQALDFLLCVGGKFVAVETKAIGMKLTPVQVRTVMEMHKAKAITFVISTDAEIDYAIRQIKKLAGETNDHQSGSQSPSSSSNWTTGGFVPRSHIVQG